MLNYAACFFAASLVIHGVDRLRRAPPRLYSRNSGGAMGRRALVDGWIGDGLVVLFVLCRHRLGPLLAVVVGFAAALGVVAFHLLPRWSVLSDSFASGDTDLLAWVVVLAEIVGAFALGVVGACALRMHSQRMQMARLL